MRARVASTRTCRRTGGIIITWVMLKDSRARAICSAVGRIRAEKAETGRPRTATGASVARTNASACAREVRKRRKSRVWRTRPGSPVLKTKKQSLPDSIVLGSSTPSGETGKAMVPISMPSGILPAISLKNHEPDAVIATRPWRKSSSAFWAVSPSQPG